MDRKALLIVAICLTVLMWVPPVLPQARPSQCEAEYQKWLSAAEALRSSMQAYRNVREESIAPRIEQNVAAGKRSVSLARTVRTVLQERRRKMDEAEEVCRREVEKERYAFEQWYGCSSGGRTRRGAPASADLREASAERDRLLKDLRELLMDEAHAQYKNARPQSSRTADLEDPSQLNAGYRTERGAASGYPGNPYQGYYR